MPSARWPPASPRWACRAGEVAFGIVTTIGTVTSATLAGVGLNMVRLRLVASMPGTGDGPAAVQNLVRIAALSVGLAGGVR